MTSPSELRDILERVISGNASQADLQALDNALHRGQVVFASGSHSVGIGGAVNDSIVITGSRNIIVKAEDAAAIQKVLNTFVHSRFNGSDFAALEATSRLTLSSSRQTTLLPWNQEWLTKHATMATAGINKFGDSGFVELRFTLIGFDLDKSAHALLEAAQNAQFKSLGWPLGIVVPSHRLGTRSIDIPITCWPHETEDGIVAELSVEEQNTYDYWALRASGDFYLLRNLKEDQWQPTPWKLLYEFRIEAILEALLYCVSLYKQLGVPVSTVVGIGVRHADLKRRILRGSRLALDTLTAAQRAAREDQRYAEVRLPLEQIQPNLTAIVKQLTDPLFQNFDFMLPDEALDTIVRNFVRKRIEAGEVTDIEMAACDEELQRAILETLADYRNKAEKVGLPLRTGMRYADLIADFSGAINESELRRSCDVLAAQGSLRVDNDTDLLLITQKGLNSIR